MNDVSKDESQLDYYDEDMEKFKDGSQKDMLVYMNLDVNGLKVVNDTLGHKAGDELIRGAATCM